MDRKFYKKCLKTEIFDKYFESKKHCNIFDKIWLLFLSPESNCIYLIRKKELFESRGKLFRLRSRFIHRKLILKYGIHITEGTTIGIGLRIAHPVGIVITKCKIGDYFTIYQNCTIGQKKPNTGLCPTIGNHVTMFASSSIIGKVNVASNVVIGAGSLVLQDIDKPGIYVGSPARFIKKID